MENKKPIIIAVVVLIIVATFWVLVGKFQNLKGAKKANPPVSNETPKDNSVTTEESLATRGIITDFNGSSLTLRNEMGQTTIENTPETTIYMIDMTGLPVETKIAELEKGKEALVVHKKSVARKKVVASNIIQGTVIALANGEITLQTEEGLKNINITSNPTIYMGEGAQALDKQVNDIAPGSEITVAYADAETKLQVVGIRIDKL